MGILNDFGVTVEFNNGYSCCYPSEETLVFICMIMGGQNLTTSLLS